MKRLFFGLIILSLTACAHKKEQEIQSKQDNFEVFENKLTDNNLEPFIGCDFGKTFESFWETDNAMKRRRVSFNFSNEDFTIKNQEPKPTLATQSILQININDKLSYSNHSSSIEKDTFFFLNKNIYPQTFAEVRLIKENQTNTSIKLDFKDYIFIELLSSNRVKGSYRIQGLEANFDMSIVKLP